MHCTMLHWFSLHTLNFVQVVRSALFSCGATHKLGLICKAILGLLPTSLQTYILPKSMGSYCPHSKELLLLSIPKGSNWIGKEKACKNVAPSASSLLHLNLMETVCLKYFFNISVLFFHLLIFLGDFFKLKYLIGSVYDINMSLVVKWGIRYIGWERKSLKSAVIVITTKRRSSKSLHFLVEGNWTHIVVRPKQIIFN